MATFGKYVLTDMISEHPGISIHRGYRAADRQPVVLKRLHNDYPSPRELARLHHEYALLQGLQMPGVIRALELEQDGRRLALVMEDRGGQPLSEVLRAGQLPLETVLALSIHIAGTLGALHRQRLVHKDLKPSNILYYAASRTTDLIDFGIATRLPQEVQEAKAPQVLEGTLAYLSPEQTGRMNRSVDARSDLYSFGVLLYELLTGRVPFVSQDPMELVHSHLARLPTPPHAQSAAIPEALSDVVMKLLAKAPEDRYQSAGGAKADLELCLKQWQATGTIARFALGLQDRGHALRIPQKLYGRHDEIAALLAAFARIRQQSTELLLIAGPSGIGKSALVREVHKPIAQHGGYFAIGKFDQLNRSVPYAALGHAFRRVVQQILTESAESLSQWKRILGSASCTRRSGTRDSCSSS